MAARQIGLAKPPTMATTPSAVHALHLGRAALGRRAGVAEHHLELRAAERLDAAGGVDRLDGEFGAELALLAVLAPARR